MIFSLQVCTSVYSVQWRYNCCWVWSIVILYIWNKNCSDEYFNVFIFKSLYRGVDKNPNDVSCLYTHRTYKWAPWRVCKKWQNTRPSTHQQSEKLEQSSVMASWRSGEIECDENMQISQPIWQGRSRCQLAVIALTNTAHLCCTEKKPPETKLS